MLDLLFYKNIYIYSTVKDIRHKRHNSFVGYGNNLRNYTYLNLVISRGIRTKWMDSSSKKREHKYVIFMILDKWYPEFLVDHLN